MIRRSTPAAPGLSSKELSCHALVIATGLVVRELDNLVERARAHGAQKRFEFRKRHLDRIEVRTVGWEKPEARRRNFSGLTSAGALVASDESLVAVDSMFRQSGFTWTQLLYALADSDHPGETLRGFGVGYPDLDKALSQ